jgi:hypothetical protein
MGYVWAQLVQSRPLPAGLITTRALHSGHANISSRAWATVLLTTIQGYLGRRDLTSLAYPYRCHVVSVRLMVIGSAVAGALRTSRLRRHGNPEDRMTAIFKVP